MDNKFMFTVVTDVNGHIIKVTESSLLDSKSVLNCHPDVKFRLEVSRLILNIKILKFFKKYSLELPNQKV